MRRSAFASALAALAMVPPWLVAVPGRPAYVAEATWTNDDRPEAALTRSLRSAARDPDDQNARPTDALGAPVGTKVTFEAFVTATVARVRLPGDARPAYARVDRLVPAVPRGTRLAVAGGFGGSALFYPALAAPIERAASLPSGTAVAALGTATAPYDPEGGDFVRLQVRVLSGPRRGRIGWVPAAYLGLPGLGPYGSVAERACRCRLLELQAP